MVKPTFLNLPEEKRRRIIDVALEEFAARPYSKASLSNIVTRAGIAKGSIYQYFEDKKDLYIYLLELATAEKIAYIREVIDPQADFFAEFEQSMLAGFRFNQDHPQLNRVIANAMEPFGEEVLQEMNIYWKRMTLDFFEKMVVRGQEQGVVRQDIDIRLMANLLYYVLSPGLGEYILETVDSTMHDFLADPESVNRLNQNQVQHVVKDVMKFLRNGLGDGGGVLIWKLLF